MLGIPEQVAIRVLLRMAEDPQVLGRFLEQIGPMPNVQTKTMGGAVFWIEIANIQGWRLQRNRVFNNYRILNPDHIRVAWGGESAMVNTFKSFEQTL